MRRRKAQFGFATPRQLTVIAETPSRPLPALTLISAPRGVAAIVEAKIFEVEERVEERREDGAVDVNLSTDRRAHVEPGATVKEAITTRHTGGDES